MLNSRKVKDEVDIFSGILTSHLYLGVFAVIVVLQARLPACRKPVHLGFLSGINYCFLRASWCVRVTQTHCDSLPQLCECIRGYTPDEAAQC